MKQTLVLTDFDGTLTRHDTFPLFLRFVLGKRFVLLFPVLVWNVVCMKAGILSAQQAKERILAAAVRGWDRTHLQNCGRAFIETLLADTEHVFRPGALEMIERHKKAGSRVMVVSASPEEWVSAFADKLCIECISTRLEYDEYGFTGKIAGKNCTGEEKVKRISEMIPDVSLYDVEAYGDSQGDLPMLGLANKAFYKPFFWKKRYSL